MVILLSLPALPVIAEPHSYERSVVRMSAKSYAHQLVKPLNQWGCLVRLWERESHWNPKARNRSSGAFGIPQALPGWKMASAGADWAVNPLTQVTWGVHYVKNRYGDPCRALDHSNKYGWY